MIGLFVGAVFSALISPASAADASWEARFRRAQATAITGAVPAAYVSIAGAPGAAWSLAPNWAEEHFESLQGPATIAGGSAALSAPLGLVGLGMMAGGSLRARRAAVELGHDVSGTYGGVAWALLPVSAALGGAAFALAQEDKPAAGPLVVLALTSFTFGQAAAHYQLHLARRAINAPARDWRARYTSASAAQWFGPAFVGIGAAGGGLGLLMFSALDRYKPKNPIEAILMIPVLVIVAASGIALMATSVPLVVAGPLLMNGGAFLARNALAEGGQAVSPVPAIVGVGALGGAIGFAVVGLVNNDWHYAIASAGLYGVSIGTWIAQRALNGTAYRRLQESESAGARILIPIVDVRF